MSCQSIICFMKQVVYCLLAIWLHVILIHLYNRPTSAHVIYIMAQHLFDNENELESCSIISIRYNIFKYIYNIQFSLIEAPVHLFIHFVFQTGNHVAAVQSIKWCRCRSSSSEQRKCLLSWLLVSDCGLSISETANHSL